MPFLDNAWYLAAWSSELGDQPLGRIIAGRHIVIFRQAEGTLCAVGDRCPHRFAPLHLGKVVGDAIECPYHGLRFGADGHCVFNPHGTGKIPAAAKVPGYPLVERHRGVWLWLGEAELADPGLIPDYSFLDDCPASALVVHLMETEGNYQLLLDNLLDLSHVDYLHVGSLSAGNFATTLPEVREAGTSVHADWWMGNSPVPPTTAQSMNLSGPDIRLDQWLEVRWDAPCNLVLRAGATEPGAVREAGIDTLSLHALTPATETSTHYFFANTRNFRVDDAAMTALMKEIVANQFNGEDKPMIEAQQRMMGTADLFSLKPVLLPQDGAAVRVRRKLEQMIKAEKTRPAAVGG